MIREWWLLPVLIGRWLIGPAILLGLLGFLGDGIDVLTDTLVATLMEVTR
jgi:hypothetical protein